MAYTNIALGAHTDNTYFVRQRMSDPVLFVEGHFRQILLEYNSSTSSHTQTDQVVRRSWSTDSTSRRS